jgi:hypothetical protein
MNAGKRYLGLLLAAAMACVVPEALAQFRSGVPGGGFPGGGTRGSRGGGDSGANQRQPGEQRPEMQENAVNLADYRLELLHVDLKLAPEQEPVWKSFADKVSAMASDMARERARLQSTLQLKAVQRIDQSVDVARNRLTALEDIASSAKALYARLTPEQQTIADARLATTIPSSFGQSVGGIGGMGAMRGGPGPKDAPRPPQ